MHSIPTPLAPGFASLCFALLSSALSISPVLAQGVPTFDAKGVLQDIKQFEQMVKDYGIQTDQLDQLVAQLEALQKQIEQYDEIIAAVSNPSDVLDLLMEGDLDGMLGSKFDSSFLATVTKGAGGDWSGLTDDRATEFVASVSKVLAGAGTTQEKITALAESANPNAQRNAAATTSSAATSAAAEIAYEEAEQSVRRTTILVEEIGELKTLKESVDHNTRVTAELAIALAAMWQLESVQTMNVGLLGVTDAATLAETERFFDFTLQEIE
ncbi:type IV secretion system protein [Tropicimonas isoalkanivorans]|uniref:Type IV secretion system protein VirB5 n=1 Tax=Tropicimonas isoalkanivorans TaxID=441112 RepID=A0A1I1Q408_9RHOB|nr:type IV secretion system protein [Tropicimonas isoalkanivorans]SFD14598.1 type IV secretion system protein VirB5 [Tropicimonas isoalkanivorans]